MGLILVRACPGAADVCLSLNLRGRMKGKKTPTEVDLSYPQGPSPSMEGLLPSNSADERWDSRDPQGSRFGLPTCVFADRCVISHQKESMHDDGHH